ncbi:MAG: nucleotidyltransferase domain-containing protein [Gammaproteobacteria bacterium]
MARKTPVEVLFGTYHRRILALLLLHPEQSYYVREIGRAANVPAGSVHRELRRLAESGLLLREASGNQVRYRANQDCPIFPELAGIFRKTEGLADILRAALSPLASEIEFAFIFGSVAQGKEGVTSDVDVLVIGEVPFASLVQALAPTQDRLGREVNPVIMPKKDFLEKYETKDRFVTRIVKEPKIFLLGTANSFEALVHRQHARDLHQSSA